MRKEIDIAYLLGLICVCVMCYSIGYSNGASKPFNQYEVLVGNYSTTVYKDGRYVGEIGVDTTSQFDKLIIKDNE